MNGLILETSSDFGMLVLSKEGVPITSRALDGGPSLSKKIASETHDLLTAFSFRPDFIAVGTGPGSYTGIRVGAALAQSLAYGWNIPCMSFCSLIAFTPPQIQGPFAIVLDAKSAGIYVLTGQRQVDSLVFDEPQLLPPMTPLLQTLPYLASPHPDLICARASYSGQWVETRPDPNWLASFCRLPDQGQIPPFQFTYLSSPS